ncbi:MAG: DUF1854 domain-containing protein [Fimbriimonas sp.]
MEPLTPDPKQIHLFFEPKDRLRLTVADTQSFPTVKPTWASPLSHPDHFLVLLNGKGEEILTIKDPDKDLTEPSRKAVREELSRRYLTAQIISIVDAKVEYGATYWHVHSNRGEREFVTQSLQENAQWLAPTHLLLIDVDGNRFEIRNVDDLDTKSREFLDSIL